MPITQPIPIPDGQICEVRMLKHASQNVCAVCRTAAQTYVCTLADTAQSGNSVRKMNKWLASNFGVLTQDLYAPYKPVGDWYERECHDLRIFLVGSEFLVNRFFEVWSDAKCCFG